MNELSFSNFYAQISMAILGAFIWYLIQLVMEHRGYSKKLCTLIDLILDKAAFLLTKKDEYKKIILSDIAHIESSWKKIIFFLKSLIRKKPQSNIPDLKEKKNKKNAE